MLRMLYMSHSGLRYLVLLAGLSAVAWALFALMTKKPWSSAGRALGSAFVGLLDLQILLGLVLLKWWYSPRVIGHLVMMVAAAGVAHGLLVLNRRRPSPSWALLLAGVAAALVCITLGILAIGRSPLQMTAG